mgnify:CR=1 FL=1
MDVRTESHREQVIKLLTQLNERQRTIFNRVDKIEMHLKELNGKVAKHENQLTRILTWGGIVILFVPIIINILMRGLL